MGFAFVRAERLDYAAIEQKVGKMNGSLLFLNGNWPKVNERLANNGLVRRVALN